MHNIAMQEFVCVHKYMYARMYTHTHECMLLKSDNRTTRVASGKLFCFTRIISI